ncbi:MAG: leucine--tRNA ligase [Fimbriimonadaceae bacterium]|nr:leucine--tRNA ligase [Fimbriimonadaceae bacterium]
MPDRYEPSTFEAKWRERWKEADLFRTREEPERPKFYGLDFFPYPSGAGLSVGHCRNYIPTDVQCRMKFMQGCNVLHPMGFDAFGLPAENEAIAKQTHPREMIERYAANYRRQMELVGISYDWSRSFSSSDPSYYRWTQWIFKKLFERGLAYRKMASVNWCPVDATVLADEEVVGGLCWRCDSPVEKRWIPQWFFKITEYAQRLLDDLDGLDWPEGIKQQQRNWIGRSEGVEFEIRIAPPRQIEREEPEADFQLLTLDKKNSFRVFTTRIDTIFGMTFCVLAPEHPLVERLLGWVPEDNAEEIRLYRDAAKRLSDTDRLATTREKTGVFTGAYAVNPANGERVPIWVADYVLAGYGTGAIMAVPAHDERDFEFATKFRIPIVQVIRPPEGESEELPFDAKEGTMMNSGEYDGLSIHDGQRALGEWIEALGIGERKVQYRLRDWLISRQRYWGCPIPVIHTKEEEIQLVPDECLPVELPDVEHYEPSGDGTSPLAQIDEFVNTTDLDGRLGRRETDTMGGFACSSWYFLRFCDPHNDDAPWDPERVRYWMPVDSYVGGAEHAVMHLLYARFWTKVLYNAGLVPVSEPFQRLENQGQVLARTPYRLPREDERLAVGEEGVRISFDEARALREDQIFYRWARMSKSKGNVVTPDEVVENEGADALRVYELFVAPFEQDVQWSNEGLQGAVRFLSRVFKLAHELLPVWEPEWRASIGVEEMGARERDLRRATHQTIRKATEDIDRFAFNTYIAALMTFLNTLTDAIRGVDLDQASRAQRLALSEALESLVLILSPAAPHSADEIWESLRTENAPAFTYLGEWPSWDPEIAKDESVTVAIQVNGKLRDTVELPAGASKEAHEAAALASERAKTHREGKEIRRVIVVPDKLVNIVAN